MDKGDLALWTTPRTIIVLEGVLVDITEKKKGRLSSLFSLANPESEWAWNILAMKIVNDQATRFNRVFEVVTFIDELSAEKAADTFERYGVRVTVTNYSPFDLFCESLLWRTDIDRVVDSDDDRLMRYGQRGYRWVAGSDGF